MAAGDLTLLDTDTRAGDSIYDIRGDGNFIYAACQNSGLRVFSVDGLGQITLVDSDDQGDSYNGLWTDGNVVLVGCGFGGLRSYLVDGGGNLTFVDQDLQGGVVPGNEYQGAESDLLTFNSNTVPLIALDGIVKEVKIKGTFRAESTVDPGLQVFQPVFGGTINGTDYGTNQNISQSPQTFTFDITNDPFGPGLGNWTWDDVRDLDIKHRFRNDSGGPKNGYVYIVQVVVSVCGGSSSSSSSSVSSSSSS